MNKVQAAALISVLVAFVYLYEDYFPPILRQCLQVFLGHDESSSTEYKVIIGVVSSQDRFEQRNAIRETWKTLAGKDSRVFFVVPETPCPIDSFWRIHEAICAEWDVQVPFNLNENVLVRPLSIANSNLNVRPGPGRDGVRFRVKFPVAVTELGLAKIYFSSFSSSDENPITVELLDAVSGETFSAVEFNRNSKFTEDEGYLYLPIKEDILTANFEGIIRIKDSLDKSNQTINLDKLFCHVTWHSDFGRDGLFLWSGSFRHGKLEPLSPDQCPLVSLTYRVPDILELKLLLASRETQNQCQLNKNSNLVSKLVEEMEDNEDDIFLASGPDVYDVPQSMSNATLSFMKWIVQEFDFQDLLLTEDRTFVAIDKVLSRLQEEKRLKRWRSNFSFYEPLTIIDSQTYISATYPPKPSEAGSILSRDLVEALVTGSANLNSFSSLSASLSIWLAPFAPFHIFDAGFSHNATCRKSSAVMWKFDSKVEMKTAWTNYRKCSRACFCKNN